MVERGLRSYGQKLAKGFSAENLVYALGWPGDGWGLQQSVGSRKKLEVLFRVDGTNFIESLVLLDRADMVTVRL